MTKADATGTGWRRSSYSGTNGECVEAAASSRAVMVRDSKDPDGTRLLFGINAWRAFAAAIKVDMSVKG